ncbi:hypothetical protein [Shewanella ulleungensis]|nr:hypothetical protein [Shewanella ulleungensis]MCL1148591.1 hypothetical protein [Shewanella ulleungensis]
MAYTGYLSDIFKSVKMQFNAGRCATTLMVTGHEYKTTKQQNEHLDPG